MGRKVEKGGGWAGRIDGKQSVANFEFFTFRMIYSIRLRHRLGKILKIRMNLHANQPKARQFVALY